MIYEVGKPVTEFIGKNDGVYFKFDDSGAMVTVLMYKPNATEINAFKQGQQLRMAIFIRRKQMIMLFKFGDMPWMDAPFFPQIEPPFTMSDIEDGMSIATQVMLVDTADGVVKSLRIVSPPTKFARDLVKTIREIADEPFDKRQYASDLIELFEVYSTRMMVSESSFMCKIS